MQQNILKETARTDTEQKPIQFNFDEYDEYLKMTPMEYAMERLEQEAIAEAKRKAEKKQEAEKEKLRSEAFEKTRNGARFSKNSVMPSKNLAWAIENGVLSSQDQGALWSAVNRRARGEQLVQFNDGLYMVERGNKIMITDADKDVPSLEAVYEIQSDNGSIISAVKGVFYDEARNGGNSKTAYRIAQLAFEDAGTLEHAPQDYGTHGRYDARGKGSLRGADNQGYSKRKDKGEVRRKSIAAEDAEYMELAKEPVKNRVRLQEMVDEKAKKAGYTYKVFHGTPMPSKKGTFPFTIFKGGVWNTTYTATSRELASTFTNLFESEGFVYDLYAKLDNPLVVNEHVYDEVPWYYDVPVPSEMKEKKATSYYRKETERAATEDIAHYAKDNGYDGVIVEGIRENSGTYTDDIIVFNSNRLKSADPVTYDDEGNVIPLSERFRTDRTGDEEWKNGDIRFSKAAPAADEAADMRDLRLADVLARTAKGPEGEAIRRAAEREKNDAVQAVKEQAKLDRQVALAKQQQRMQEKYERKLQRARGRPGKAYRKLVSSARSIENFSKLQGSDSICCNEIIDFMRLPTHVYHRILFALTVWKIFPRKAKLRKSSPSATKCRRGVFCSLNSHTG